MTSCIALTHGDSAFGPASITGTVTPVDIAQRLLICGITLASHDGRVLGETL
jgi:hypothetical protein